MSPHNARNRTQDSCREFDWTQLECPIFIEAITDLFGLFRAQ